MPGERIGGLGRSSDEMVGPSEEEAERIKKALGIVQARYNAQRAEPTGPQVTREAMAARTARVPGGRSKPLAPARPMPDQVPRMRDPALADPRAGDRALAQAQLQRQAAAEGAAAAPRAEAPPPGPAVPPAGQDVPLDLSDEEWFARWRGGR